ncbi:unnamed protein product [Cochlearia groenlandica]
MVSRTRVLDYAFEQEKLKNAMELNENIAARRVSLKEKEVELNMVIKELRKNKQRNWLQLNLSEKRKKQDLRLKSFKQRGIKVLLEIWKHELNRGMSHITCIK